VAELLRHCRYAKTHRNAKSMAEKTSANVYLEAVEKGTNEIQKSAKPRNSQRTSMAVGKHKERLLENCKKPDTELRSAR